MKINFVFIFANSAETDEMPHYAAFHLGLHCLPKVPVNEKSQLCMLAVNDTGQTERMHRLICTFVVYVNRFSHTFGYKPYFNHRLG